MREQAPIVTGYVDVLVRRLHESSASPVNIAGWLGFTMFDIIGDLVFGESFDCLQTSNLHVSLWPFFHCALVRVR